MNPPKEFKERNGMKKKQEPIVIVLPESMKHREFKIAFEKHLEDVTHAFFLDIDMIRENTLEPLAMFDGLRLKLEDIEKTNVKD